MIEVGVRPQPWNFEGKQERERDAAYAMIEPCASMPWAAGGVVW